MSDFLFPHDSRITTSRWDMVANTAASRSIFNGAVQTLGRSGDRLRASITVANSHDTKLTYAEQSSLKQIRARLRGHTNRCFLADPFYTKRGSFPTFEVLGNNTFESATGWTSSAAITQTVADRVLRATRNAVGATATTLANSAAVTVVNGFPYVLRVMLVLGKGPYTTGHRLHFGSTSGGSEYLLGSTSTAFGMMTLAVVTSASSLFVGVRDASTTGQAIGDFVEIPYISLSRCALVAGGFQIGAGLAIDGLPTSTAGLLLMGDRVQIGNQLNMVVAPLNSDSSGAGYLLCANPWRASPADNDPVVIHNPMGRFVLMSNEGGWDDRPGKFSDFAFDFEEALDA
jgi:hypothetical protein